MADDVSVRAGSSGEKAVSDGGYDATLDFFSEKFDPIKALYTPGVRPPLVAAKTHDNVARYESACKQSSADRAPCSQKRKVAPPTGTKTYERKWLPHQLPVKSERRNRKQRDIFEKMDAVEGPLRLLKDCRDNRVQIKVFTRHSHGIRGFCTGYVTMFDRHFNMTLEDVLEEWKRPKRRKIPALSESFQNSAIRTRIQPPEVNVIRSDKKTETCQRRVNQMLLRGEHVAYVVVLKNLDK